MGDKSTWKWLDEESCVLDIVSNASWQAGTTVTFLWRFPRWTLVTKKKPVIANLENIAFHLAYLKKNAFQYLVST